MRGVSFSDMACSIARTLDVIGERWTLLVLRDAFVGVRRFEDFQASLGIARNVLADRLQTLVEHGVLERRRYQEHPERFEYRLTDRGLELFPVLIGLMQWGDRYRCGVEGPPFEVRHHGCGGEAKALVICDGCGERLTARDTRRLPGPGLIEAPERPSEGVV